MDTTINIETTVEDFLQTALGGNMNFGMLKPKAIEDLMESYSRFRINELVKTYENHMGGAVQLGEFCENDAEYATDILKGIIQYNPKAYPSLEKII